MWWPGRSARGERASLALFALITVRPTCAWGGFTPARRAEEERGVSVNPTLGRLQPLMWRVEFLNLTV